MKEIASVASNLLLLPLENGQVKASAELIILTSEPSYGTRGEEITKDRPLEAMRVCVDLRAVGGLIQALHNLGEEMEKMEADYNQKLPAAPSKKNYLVYQVGKNAVGKFEMWTTESPSKHYGLGTYNTVAAAKAELEMRHPGWLIEGPEPLKDCDTGIVVFKVTPQ